MIGLSQRISTGAKKSKNAISLPPVVITEYPADIAKSENVLVKTFLQATTTDEQLASLKKMLDNTKDVVDSTIMKVFVVVFIHAKAKHPVKGFLTRHITKSEHLQESFIELLSSEIRQAMAHVSLETCVYKDVVTKIGMCLENFPAGTQAVDNVALMLFPYLAGCLQECQYTIMQKFQYSPSEMNIVYNLIHSTLRLVLHITTKIQWKPQDEDEDPPHDVMLQKQRYRVELCLNNFLNDNDVPMDTKSLCGLVTVSLIPYQCSPQERNSDTLMLQLLRYQDWDAMSDAKKLALSSAILTTVPMKLLQKKLQHLDEGPLLIDLMVQNLMDIVERKSTDGLLILGVSRALHQLSKSLPQLEEQLSERIAERLLTFVWVHLDHYMDSVRHLTAQMLAALIQHCAHLELTSGSGSLQSALSRLQALGSERRGFQLGVRGCARALGAARVLRSVAPLPRLLQALRCEELMATVSGTLDELLERHMQETEASVIHEEWVLPILQFVQSEDLEPEMLTILENLLAKAVKLDQNLVTFILPHVKQACESPERDLRDVVLLLSVTRGSLAPASTAQERWGGVLSYNVLEDAVLDARDEVRLGALALACAGAGAGARGGHVALHYLAHSDGEHAPHCRLRALAAFDKLVKRVVAGYRAAEDRQLVERLRRQCYDNLQRGACHSRRCTALHLLLTCERAAPYPLTWKLDDVEKLLLHLDDSYETNKQLALDVLLLLPLEVLKEAAQSDRLQVEALVQQANALQPSECESAAYKLELLWRRLPDRLLHGSACEAAEPALFTVVSRLASVLYAHDVLHAPRDSPAYGVLHCIAHLLDRVAPDGIAKCRKWHELFERIFSLCESLLERAGQVVNHAAPEGLLPERCLYSDYGNDAGVMLEDGREVTAQMVLLCAWRTVKEAAGLLGAAAGAARGARGARRRAARLLGAAVRRARHRGALDQAAGAYRRLLHGMWRDKELRWYPAHEVALTLQELRAGRALGPADRRGAGLPVLIQALVSTEEGAGGPGTSLRLVMEELLRMADAGAGADAEAAANNRAHAFNILRVLYRDSSLETAVQGYVGEGLRVALKGFEGASWAERNASTLLLSALLRRVFGVERPGLRARSRVTGRVFYLRYPHLYDLMLNKLKEVSESDEKRLLCPSLYPVLLILARLYPSSLEGTESNLKLVSFVPHVVQCARSRVLHTRRLAAAAAVALVAPDRYVPHLEYLLGLVSEPRIERNFCHGILLQICALLENKPEGVECGSLSALVPRTLWLLAQPCHPVLHQHVLLLTVLATSFPETLRRETADDICARLRAALSAPAPRPGAACGRALCLAACVRLLLLLLLPAALAEVALGALEHELHEVREAALQAAPALDARARAALAEQAARALRAESTWRAGPQRVRTLLQVLVAEEGTQELVVKAAPPQFPWPLAIGGSSRNIILNLQGLMMLGPEHFMDLYLESYTRYVCPRVQQLEPTYVLHVARSLRVCSAWSLPGAVRAGAARALLALAPALLARPCCFDAESAVLVALGELVRDAEGEVRALAARAVLLLAPPDRPKPRAPDVVSGAARALLLRACAARARGAALLAALALCGAPARAGSERDQRRVFEPNEKENDYGEELVWAAACADRFVDLCVREGVHPLTHLTDHVLVKFQLPIYFNDYSKLALLALASGEDAADAHPTYKVFIERLKREI